MARKLAWAFLAGVLGYLAGAFGGAALVELLSANTHDRGMEAAMTSIFVYGPLVGVVAFGVALVAQSARRSPPGQL